MRLGALRKLARWMPGSLAVLGLELRASRRRRRTYAVRTAYLAALAGIAALVWLAAVVLVLGVVLYASLHLLAGAALLWWARGNLRRHAF